MGGRASERMGPDRQVTKEAFDRLCDNLHPITGERLTLRTTTTGASAMISSSPAEIVQRYRRVAPDANEKQRLFQRLR